MKAAVTDGGSPTFERDDQQRKVPIGLDKSWESRRIEGIELMVSSIEQQKERQKKNTACKSCPHGSHRYYNNNGSSCCSGHHHHHHHHHHDGNVVAVDNGFVMPKEKTRSLTGMKKNKMSITTSAPQKSLVFDSLTHIEGSSVGRRQKQTVHADMAHNACLTPDSFKVRELEQQVLDLIHQLAQEKHQSRQDKISLSKLQQQVARNKSEKPVKEMLMKELEQEKRRRDLLEQKLRDRNVDCCCQNEMVVLKKENTRLNEVVQDLLPYKNKVERLKQSNASSAALLEAELHRLRSKLESLDQDNSLTNMELRKLESIIKNCQGCTAQLVGQIRLDGTPRSETASTTASVSNDSDNKTKVLLERLKNLEAEKSSLVLENEAQFRHYEKCLEDVTNQILDALLVQKTLKEECSHLKERVAHLEEENGLLKQSQSNGFRASAASMTNNRGASVADEFCLQMMLFRPDQIQNESCRSSGRPGSREMPAELRDDDDCDDGVEEGCQSSLSLNEILDSAAGSTNGSTDAEDGNGQAGEKRKSLAAKDEEERSKDEWLETEARKKTQRNDFGGGPRYREDVCNPNVRPNNLNVFVDMSASDSFALLGNCSCSNGQFIHLGATSSAESSADVNGNLVSESESAPLDKQPGPPSKSSGHRKVFRGDSGWKKFLPVGCTSPQEERDEGYLSNKTSEGSSDVSNPFASRASYDCS